jgi:hypothetical protein
MELKEKTKISPRILAKHLTQMTSLQIIEKKKDAESGKYPIPVFYQATPELITYIRAVLTREETANLLEPALNKTKDPLQLLEAIHESSQLYFIELLKQIQQNKNITNQQIWFFAECFLWTNYKKYTIKLIEASRKITDDFNINQLYINQAKRQIRTSTALLRIYNNSKKEPQKKT